jgi:hypothetical protein
LIDDRDNLEPWIQSKIAQSSEAIEAVRRYTEYNAAKAEVAMPDDIADDGDVEEGFKILPNIDRERYQERDGLEGPFRTTSGKVVYYDPAEGRYYDPDSDIYLSHDEWDALNEEFLIEFLPALAALGLGAVRAAAGVAGGAARAIGRTAATSAMKAATAGLGQGGSSSDSDGMSSGYDFGKTMNSSAEPKGTMIEDADFSDKEIKMAFGIINDPRWKSGNMTHIVDTIEKIAKGLSKHPSVAKAIQATNEGITWDPDTHPTSFVKDPGRWTDEERDYYESPEFLIMNLEKQIRLIKAGKHGVLGPEHIPGLEKEIEHVKRTGKGIGQYTLPDKKIATERKMSGAEKTKEKKLKTKYDDSGMKKSMKDQYGDEEGMKVYYATLRKKAMTKGAK